MVRISNILGFMGKLGAGFLCVGWFLNNIDSTCDNSDNGASPTPAKDFAKNVKPVCKTGIANDTTHTLIIPANQKLQK